MTTPSCAAVAVDGLVVRRGGQDILAAGMQGVRRLVGGVLVEHDLDRRTGSPASDRALHLSRA